MARGLDRVTVQEDDVDFAAYMHMTDHEHKVRAVNDYRQDLLDEVAGKSEWGKVSYLPWLKLRDLFAYRPGEVSVYVGFNGHGKSLVVGQIMLSQMAQGEIVLVISLEMKPRRTLARKLRQFVGRRLDQIHGWEVDQFVDWCEGKLWLYDQQGMVDQQKIIAVIRWAIEHRGVTHVVVDNLAKMCKSEEDMDGQKFFVDALCTIARDTSTHMHLVVHPRKNVNEEQPPRKMDIRGSSTISDAPDNVFCIYKNKPKIEARQRNDPSKDHEPDGLVVIDKQRNGEWEGRLGLAFHVSSQQLIQTDSYCPQDYKTPFPHREKAGHA
jgi:twinkle protein